jgi:hypothetical protein
MRKLVRIAMIGVFALTLTSPAPAEEVSATAVFERLKSLAGVWRGGPVGEGKEAEAETAGEVVHEFRISAAGTVVMETMFRGTDHEMINMYHVDGDDLVLTHYCAEGNQPTMRLDRKNSTTDKLVFDFAGGTNLDPAVDQHIHAAEVTLLDADRIKSAWKPYAGGEQVGLMTFELARSE